MIWKCISIIAGMIYSVQADWPAQVQDIVYPCSIDTSLQPAMYYKPSASGPVPLLVGLHSWSWGYNTALSEPYGQWAVDSGWAFIAPHFRGPNGHPISTGSNAVVQDIIDAVAYVKSQVTVDTNRIYVIGLSGGGHATMLMSGKAAHIWGGASAWVGISDLTAWYQESIELGSTFWQSIQNACGGNPTTDSAAAAQSYNRSPIHFLYNATDFNLDINGGITDGTVPVSQSLRAFNAMAAPGDTLTNEEIEYFATQHAVPPSLAGQAPYDPLYGTGNILFRRISNNARITIFNGGHVINYNAGLTWLSRQRRNATTTNVERKKDPAYPEIVVLPNPFNPSTAIVIKSQGAKPESYKAIIEIYNIMGELVESPSLNLSNGIGLYKWNAGKRASGIYILKVKVDNHILTKKITLLR